MIPSDRKRPFLPSGASSFIALGNIAQASGEVIATQREQEKLLSKDPAFSEFRRVLATTNATPVTRSGIEASRMQIDIARFEEDVKAWNASDKTSQATYDYLVARQKELELRSSSFESRFPELVKYKEWNKLTDKYARAEKILENATPSQQKTIIEAGEPFRAPIASDFEPVRPFGLNVSPNPLIPSKTYTEKALGRELTKGGFFGGTRQAYEEGAKQLKPNFFLEPTPLGLVPLLWGGKTPTQQVSGGYNVLFEPTKGLVSRSAYALETKENKTLPTFLTGSNQFNLPQIYPSAPKMGARGAVALSILAPIVAPIGYVGAKRLILPKTVVADTRTVIGKPSIGAFEGTGKNLTGTVVDVGLVEAKFYTRGIFKTFFGKPPQGVSLLAEAKGTRPLNVSVSATKAKPIGNLLGTEQYVVGTRRGISIESNLPRSMENVFQVEEYRLQRVPDFVQGRGKPRQGVSAESFRSQFINRPLIEQGNGRTFLEVGLGEAKGENFRIQPMKGNKLAKIEGTDSARASARALYLEKIPKQSGTSRGILTIKGYGEQTSGGAEKVRNILFFKLKQTKPSGKPFPSLSQEISQVGGKFKYSSQKNRVRIANFDQFQTATSPLTGLKQKPVSKPTTPSPPSTPFEPPVRETKRGLGRTLTIQEQKVLQDSFVKQAEALIEKVPEPTFDSPKIKQEMIRDFLKQQEYPRLFRLARTGALVGTAVSGKNILGTPQTAILGKTNTVQTSILETPTRLSAKVPLISEVAQVSRVDIIGVPKADVSQISTPISKLAAVEVPVPPAPISPPPFIIVPPPFLLPKPQAEFGGGGQFGYSYKPRAGSARSAKIKPRVLTNPIAVFYGAKPVKATKKRQKFVEQTLATKGYVPYFEPEEPVLKKAKKKKKGAFF